MGTDHGRLAAPGRALLVGLPLTLAAIAAAAHWILGIAWTPAFLLGAVLSPTDPAMVRALLEQEAVPTRLRNLLSVESGLNDGLVLPPIAVLLAILGGRAAEPFRSTLEAVGGIVIGVAAAALAMIGLTAAWFGPKGFSSILYGALVLTSNIADAHRLYQIIGLVVTLSIVALLDDALVARAFRRAKEKG